LIAEHGLPGVKQRTTKELHRIPRNRGDGIERGM
jgi:hypothetical protein